MPQTIKCHLSQFVEILEETMLKEVQTFFVSCHWSPLFRRSHWQTLNIYMQASQREEIVNERYGRWRKGEWDQKKTTVYHDLHGCLEKFEFWKFFLSGLFTAAGSCSALTCTCSALSNTCSGQHCKVQLPNFKAIPDIFLWVPKN
jgi:hypothetical protein